MLGLESGLLITPLSDALGAEVQGFDAARPPGAEERRALGQAFLDYHLLCFRSAPLSRPAFAGLARLFGEPKIQLLRDKRDTEVPEVSLLDSTYRTAADKPDDLRRVRLAGWHTDDSYFATPAKATALQALAIPESGGETRFCNTRRAWEALPAATRRRLDGLRAVHAYDTVRAPGDAQARTADETRETPDVTHPLVRVHEDTGAKALYFNANRTDRVVGLGRADSDALLDMIDTHMTQPQFRYDHSWRLGDILLWDNRCLIHSVNVDYPVGQRRLHQRILLAGPRPV